MEFTYKIKLGYQIDLYVKPGKKKSLPDLQSVVRVDSIEGCCFQVIAFCIGIVSL